jgi:hypothetical protein
MVEWPKCSFTLLHVVAAVDEPRRAGVPHIVEPDLGVELGPPA